MGKYRKLPVVIDALLWGGKNQNEMFNFLTGGMEQNVTLEGETFRIDLVNGGCQVGNLIIKTKEGDMRADIGDYIIKGVNGEFYPCKPEIFQKTYEVVLEDDDEELAKAWSDNTEYSEEDESIMHKIDMEIKRKRHIC
jgi:hypothetical protein